MPTHPTFRGPGEFFRLHSQIVLHPIASARLMLGYGIDPRFRERIMLAVTQVNRCRFCTWFHTREALRAGLKDGEIRALLDAQFGDAPDRELPALLFAQHWAETHCAPDAAARAQFEAAYTAHELKYIYLALSVISIGNYTGGFFENLLARGGKSGECARKPAEQKET